MNKPERLRAADLAYGAIRQDLLAGRWPAGAHLREIELAAQVGVSRTPVREALRKLANEGLVQFEPHLGVRVPGWSEQDLQEIFELRVVLEGYAAGAAARNATPEQVARLRQLALDMESAAFASAPLDYMRITALNDQFHRLIVEASGNRRLVNLVAAIIELPLVVRTFVRFDQPAMRRSVGHHFDLVAAISSGNATWATAVMQAHIYAGRQIMCGQAKG